MFLKKENLFKEFPVLIGILLYAYLINWFSGNIGLIPIDTFGFLDTGHSILNGNLPIRDFWIFTGLIVDYMEAFFLLLLGNNWNSHLAHSSFMNIIATLSVYFFMKELKLPRYYIIFYSICFVLFRFFDIKKPFPVNFFDKNFKNSFGVIMDDVFAGIYVVLSLICFMVLSSYFI